MAFVVIFTRFNTALGTCPKSRPETFTITFKLVTFHCHTVLLKWFLFLDFVVSYCTRNNIRNQAKSEPLRHSIWLSVNSTKAKYLQCWQWWHFCSFGVLQVNSCKWFRTNWMTYVSWPNVPHTLWRFWKGISGILKPVANFNLDLLGKAWIVIPNTSPQIRNGFHVSVSAGHHYPEVVAHHLLIACNPAIRISLSFTALFINTLYCTVLCLFSFVPVGLSCAPLDW